MLKEKIEMILDSRMPPLRVKKSKIKEYVIEFLEEKWRFIKTEQSYYYFWYKYKNLFEFGTEKFQSLLTEITNIYPNDGYFKYLESSLKYHFYKYWQKALVKDFTYFDESSLTSFVNCWNWKVLKITSESLEEIDNWTNWIIFKESTKFEPWSFNSDVDAENKYLDDFLDGVNFSLTKFTKEEYKFLLKSYISSLFFGSLLNNRPILIFIWQKWSWKSLFFETMLQILYWKQSSLSNLPSKEDDVKAILQNWAINIFDNVDVKVWGRIIDLLCTVSTGWNIKARKLFTNSELVEMKIDTFLWMTTMSPKFTREDLMDRSILIHLDRREEMFTSVKVLKDDIEAKRNDILSSMCKWIQSDIQKLQDFQNYETNFRMSDFANLLLNLNKDNQDYVRNLLDKVIESQQKIVSEDDKLLWTLEFMLDEVENTDVKDGLVNINTGFEAWKFFTSWELYKLIVEFKRRNPGLIKYEVSSVKSLWKTLNIKKELYQKYWIKIEVKMFASNVRKYSISRI